MNTDFTKPQDSSIRIGRKDDPAMTIVPKPLNRPFRRFEIAAGLICIAAGLWLLVQFSLWFTGVALLLQISSKGEAALVLVQSVYLIGFSVNLLRSGYVALVFWMIAIAILVTQLLTVGFFN